MKDILVNPERPYIAMDETRWKWISPEDKGYSDDEFVALQKNLTMRDLVKRNNLNQIEVKDIIIILKELGQGIGGSSVVLHCQRFFCVCGQVCEDIIQR